MSVQTCSLHSQNQSQPAYSVDELSAALQSEACLDRLSADAIAEQVAFQSLPREQVQEIVEAQLCEVSNYKIIPITTRERGLVQSGCRFQEIDAANEVIERYLNPNYVEKEPLPAEQIQKLVSERLVAEVNNPFENINVEVNEADAGPILLASLVARGGALSGFLTELREKKSNLAPLIENATLFIERYERDLARLLGGRENVKAFISQRPLVQTLIPQVESLLASASTQGPAAKVAVAQRVLEALRGGMTTLQQAVEAVKASAAAARVATPVLTEVAAVAEAEGVSAWRAATQAPIVQNLRMASFASEKTRPLIFGALIVAGGLAAWYWVSED